MAQHIFTGITPPAFTPSKVGQHFIDTAAGVSYISTGTSSSADWKTSAEVEDVIVDGEVSKAPSQNAVFDALALKPSTAYVDAKVADAIVDAVTTVAPSQNAVFDALATKQALDPTLTSLAAFNDNGLLTQTALDTFTGRSIVAGSSKVTVSQGDGVAGNPSVDVVEANINHNALLNSDPNDHVDHTTVSISTTEGVQGGGDISATRTLKLDVNGLTALSLPTNRLAVDDQIAIYDTSAALHKKVSLKDFMNQRRAFIDQAYVETDDFIMDATGPMNAVGAGTGNSTQSGTYGQDTTENAIGISESDTGTTATGRRTLSSSLSQLMATLARYRFAARMAIHQLSNGTDTFTKYLGFLDNTVAGNPTNGAFFRYTHGTNGGRWEACTARAGVITATDTGVAASLPYSIFEIEISQDGANAYFYINGTLVATNTTNIPTATSAQTFGYGWRIDKSVGTAVMASSVDWRYFEMERATAR